MSWKKKVITFISDTREIGSDYETNFILDRSKIKENSFLKQNDQESSLIQKITIDTNQQPTFCSDLVNTFAPGRASHLVGVNKVEIVEFGDSSTLFLRDEQNNSVIPGIVKSSVLKVNVGKIDCNSIKEYFGVENVLVESGMGYKRSFKNVEVTVQVPSEPLPVSLKTQETNFPPIVRVSADRIQDIGVFCKNAQISDYVSEKSPIELLEDYVKFSGK